MSTLVLGPESTAPPTAHQAVEKLLARHQLGPLRRIESLAGGQLNTALRINGEWVLRFREGHRSTGSLLREANVLARVAKQVRVPEVVASGIDEVLGEYSLQQWIRGENLLTAWLRNPDTTTREWWSIQWLEALRSLHALREPLPGAWREGQLETAPSWRAYIEGRLRKRLDRLMRVPAMDRDLILAAERWVRRRAPALEDSTFCVVHRDLHFGNVLVDGPHLAALIDWELAEVGTPDYELDTIFRFLQHPWQFVPGASAHQVHATRFTSVWGWLRRGYPELFQVRFLRERLSLYALDYSLSWLHQAYTGKLPPNVALEPALARIAEILQDRYGPE